MFVSNQEKMLPIQLSTLQALKQSLKSEPKNIVLLLIGTLDFTAIEAPKNVMPIEIGSFINMIILMPFESMHSARLEFGRHGMEPTNEPRFRLIS